MMKRENLLWNKYYYINRLREKWFYPYYAPFCLKKLKFNPVFKHYAGKCVLDLQDANDYIFKLLSSNNPFMVGRFGQNELNFIIQVLRWRRGCYDKFELSRGMEAMIGAPGFFPNDMMYGEKFVDLMLDSCKDTDLIGMWHLFMEDYIIKKYCNKNITITHLNRLEPWWVCDKGLNNPWTMALKGKKVLVIHPFEQTIKKQYSENREYLFENKNILPEFELLTIKAVQGMGNKNNEFVNWFEALEYMFEMAMKEEFDVALIGCGAYGFPLASMIKKAGKQAIHLGGVLQVLFGIKGKRFEQQGYKMNQYWVRPSKEEKPPEAYKADESAYW